MSDVSNINYDVEDVVQLAVWVGYGLIYAGSETVRVEESCTRILRAYNGVEPEVFAMANYIHASIRDRETGRSVNYGKRSHRNISNLSKVDKLNNLTRQICREKPDPKDALEQVQAIINAENYPFRTHVVGVVLAALTFTLLVGGSFFSAVWAAFFSFIMIIMLRPIKKLYSAPLFVNMIGSAIIAVFAYLLKFTPYADDTLQMMTGSLMYFFPGIPLINSIRDLIAGDYNAGFGKLVETLLLACSVAIGTGAAFTMLNRIL